MLYDKPVAELMRDAAESLSDPTSANAVIQWFESNYPKVQITTVRAHIIGLTANNSSRKHYPSLAKRSPVFYQTSQGLLARFSSETHKLAESATTLDAEDTEFDIDELALVQESATAATMEFALEAYLEEFILTNWALIDWGRRLELWEDSDGRTGHQFQTPVGRLDLLARDVDTDALVVIELKRGRTSDRVVGQAARYIGWIRNNLAKPGQQVEGIVIAGDADDRLKYAVSAVLGLTVLAYQVSFELSDVGSLISGPNQKVIFDQ
jgi:RecB family endonuclease NucS